MKPGLIVTSHIWCRRDCVTALFKGKYRVGVGNFREKTKEMVECLYTIFAFFRQDRVSSNKKLGKRSNINHLINAR